MNQAQRSAYLDALGIQQWVPRDFDGHVDEYDAYAGEQQPNTEQPPQSADSAGADAAMAALTQPKATAEVQPVTPDTEQASETKPENTTTANEPPPQFRLMASLVAGQCLVINDIPHTDAHGWSAEHSQLLTNILAALNLDAGSLQHTPFNWPMFHNSAIDQGEAVAGDAVQGFVKAQMQGQQPKFILLMGQTIARYMGAADNFNETRGASPAFQDVPVCITHSVDLLLRLPQMKREVWQDLQVLISH